MKISVIMPVYNSEKYLEAAISSVLSQKGAEIEIIAVEDCSNDSSAELLKKLAESDSRIKAYFNEENVGVATVRNRALEYASGDYLAFCDSDDIVPEGAYSALLSSGDNMDVYAGGYDKLYDDGRIEGEYYVGNLKKASTFSMIFNVCSLCTKLIKRSFIQKHNLRFDSSMKIGEDVVFLAEIAVNQPKCAAVNSIVYHYCQHNTSDSRSLTHTYSCEAFSKHIECKKKLLEICADIPEAKEYVYVLSVPYITSFIPLISAGAERNAAFALYKDFLSQYDFSCDRGLFRTITGVPYEGFFDLTADRYIEKKNSFLPRETVLFEFENGMIGLKWALKYIKAWFKYKIKRS